MNIIKAAIDRTSGCGGFLNPPTHPEHTISVVSHCLDRGRWREDGLYSLSSASEASHLPENIRSEARAILDAWAPPPINSPEIRAWISQVLGYFKGCYRNPDVGDARQWHASDLVIDNRDPMLAPSDHAGVRHIRKYYPEFQPSSDDFARAKWGD